MTNPYNNNKLTVVSVEVGLVREIIECTMKEALRLIKPRFHAKCES